MKDQSGNYFTMSCCGHCRDAGNLFGERKARNDLRSYRRNGPNKPTNLLLETIRSTEIDIANSSLLDVGSGVGAIQLELFKEGLNYAVNVEASSPYIQASRKEAERQGVSDRTAYYFGDVVELSPELADAHIVTLDRVICCYPDAEKLIQATASKATQFYGVVYPRDRWITRIGLWLSNFWFWLWGSEFRTYLSPSGYIDNLIKEQGFVRHEHKQTFLWHIALYTRLE